MNEKFQNWMDEWRVVGNLEGITADLELVAGRTGVDAKEAVESLKEALAALRKLHPRGT